MSGFRSRAVKGNPPVGVGLSRCSRGRLELSRGWRAERQDRLTVPFTGHALHAQHRKGAGVEHMPTPSPTFNGSGGRASRPFGKDAAMASYAARLMAIRIM